MTNKQIYEIIKIVVTAILSIAATLFVTGCTLSLSISKNNRNSTQQTEQTNTNNMDSTQMHYVP